MGGRCRLRLSACCELGFEVAMGLNEGEPVGLCVWIWSKIISHVSFGKGPLLTTLRHSTGTIFFHEEATNLEGIIIVKRALFAHLIVWSEARIHLRNASFFFAHLPDLRNFPLRMQLFAACLLWIYPFESMAHFCDGEELHDLAINRFFLFFEPKSSSRHHRVIFPLSILLRISKNTYWRLPSPMPTELRS